MRRASRASRAIWRASRSRCPPGTRSAPRGSSARPSSRRASSSAPRAREAQHRDLLALQVALDARLAHRRVAVGNAELIGRLRTLKTNIDAGMWLAMQYTAIRALEVVPAFTAGLRELYGRDLLCDGLDRLGLEFVRPSGALYVWVRVRGRRRARRRAAARGGRSRRRPGRCIGPASDGYVRLSLTVADERLGEAVERIARVPVERPRGGHGDGLPLLVDRALRRRQALRPPAWPHALLQLATAESHAICVVSGAGTPRSCAAYASAPSVGEDSKMIEYDARPERARARRRARAGCRRGARARRDARAAAHRAASTSSATCVQHRATTAPAHLRGQRQARRSCKRAGQGARGRGRRHRGRALAEPAARARGRARACASSTARA